LVQRDDAREVIPLSSQELVITKENWERANRTQAGPAVLKYIVDDLIYKEILLREALKLHFHQTDNVVWSRLTKNMRFASQDTSLDEEELFKQALSLDMQHSDLIVRRRLIARMEQFIKNNYSIEEPTDEDIQRFIEENSDLFSKGEKVSFCHVFLSPGGGDEDAREAASRLLSKLRKDTLPPEEAYKLGNMFPHPYCFRNVSGSYLRSIFGKPFTDALLACNPSVWSGPLQSGYGTHLVRLETKKVTSILDLHENRNRARNLLTAEKEKRLIQDMVAELGSKYYTVLIDGVPADSFRLEQLLDI
jgi:hypothetical protein